MGYSVGIDLGTTFSVVARVDEHGRPIVVLNGRDRPTTPSIVCFTKAGPVVGDDAKDLLDEGSYPFAAYFKRVMGDRDFTFHAEGKDYSATDLSALVLARLKADAETRLGAPITDAVITVPAYFREPERSATIAAGRAAGLRVLQVINEPTAAAVAYGLKRSEEHQRLVVYDLGGGTFDVTVMETGRDGVRVLNSDGDNKLGGKDWDDRIVQYLASRFRDEHGIDPLEDGHGEREILVEAEQVKRRLSDLTRVTASVRSGGCHGRYELDRATFGALTGDLMARTASMCSKALEEVHLSPRTVDGILLVGGSTRMPMVHDLVQRMFGKPPLGGVNVDEAVALGAAVIAHERLVVDAGGGKSFGLGGRTKIVDVTNHSLGMIAISPDRTRFLNSRILPKNTAIPCKMNRPYQHRTKPHGRNRLEVYMTQGETDSPADVTYLGRYVIPDIPHAESGLAVIDISYQYDVSGTVKVSGAVRGSGSPLSFTVEPLPSDVPARFSRSPEEALVAHTTAYLAFDLSGSMSGNPIAEAQRAAIGFLERMDLVHASVGVIAFSDSVRTKLEATQDAKVVAGAIADLRTCETGGGNSGDPFDEVRRLMTGVAGRRFAVVLADGVWSNQSLAIQKARACHAEGIEVIAIGFGGADVNFLKAIASSEDAGIFTTLGGLADAFCSIAQVITESADGLTLDAPAPVQRRFFSRLRGR